MIGIFRGGTKILTASGANSSTPLVINPERSLIDMYEKCASFLVYVGKYWICFLLPKRTTHFYVHEHTYSITLNLHILDLNNLKLRIFWSLHGNYSWMSFKVIKELGLLVHYNTDLICSDDNIWNDKGLWIDKVLYFVKSIFLTRGLTMVDWCLGFLFS